MKNYLVYNLQTGELCRVGQVQEELWDQVFMEEGQAILEGEGRWETHYVLAGQVMAYTEEAREAKGRRPDWLTRWSNESFSWVDLRNLTQLQDAAWDRIKRDRDAMEFGPFTWGGSVFDGDSESQARIQGACQLAQLAGDSFSIDWTLQDNSVRTLSGLELLGVGQAMGLHTTTAFAIARQLREAIYTATTEQQLDAITWPEQGGSA